VLALIAGRGMLPVLLDAALRAGGRAHRVFRMADTAVEPPLADAPELRLERLGGFLDSAARQGITEVCMAGGIARPSLDRARLDGATGPLLGEIERALGLGDGGALAVVVSLFERRGLRVVGAQEICPGLLPGPGVASAARPGATDRENARRGVRLLMRLGPADLGQACVVARGQVQAVEAAPGTDFMLASLARGGRDTDAAAGGAAGVAADVAAGGVLVKMPKPDQDRRVDLPTIGPATVSGAHAAGLAGIVIESGGVLVLEREEVVARCNDAGMFLWVRERD